MLNSNFYRKIKLPKNEIHILEKDPLPWIVFLFVNSIIIILLPFSLAFKKRMELSTHDYWILVSLGASITIIANFIYFWSSDIKPYLNTRKGFFWRGTFTVVGKASILGCKFIVVKPGENHRIKVKNNIFNKVEQYDRVLIDRNYTGDLRRLQQLSGFKERVRNRTITK